MNISERISEIMGSQTSDEEKREQLHALIPADVFKIDNLKKAAPAQLKQLREALAVSEALQQRMCHY